MAAGADASGLLRAREARFLTGVGRMKRGVTMAQAAADLARVQQALGERFPPPTAAGRRRSWI